MFAHGLVIEAGLGLIEIDGREDDQGVGQIDHGGLIEEQGADKGDVLETGDGHGGHELYLDQLGAGAEIDPVL